PFIATMTKKNVFLMAAVIVLIVAAYYYMYSDWFTRPIIQISHSIRPRPAALMRGQGGDEAINGLNFGLGNEYRLTRVKVVSVPELNTNKYAHPVWELDSDSNSAPTQAFSYGSHTRGMHPPVKGAQAGPLEVNVPYRLIVEAGKLKGQHDFTITEDNH